jgi:hypothetical protein
MHRTPFRSRYDAQSSLKSSSLPLQHSSPHLFHQPQLQHLTNSLPSPFVPALAFSNRHQSGPFLSRPLFHLPRPLTTAIRVSQHRSPSTLVLDRLDHLASPLHLHPMSPPLLHRPSLPLPQATRQHRKISLPRVLARLPFSRLWPELRRVKGLDPKTSRWEGPEQKGRQRWREDRPRRRRSRGWRREGKRRRRGRKRRRRSSSRKYDCLKRHGLRCQDQCL